MAVLDRLVSVLHEMRAHFDGALFSGSQLRTSTSVVILPNACPRNDFVSPFMTKD